MILTRLGWLNYGDVSAGEETIGYNPATERSEWTRVTTVRRRDDAPLIRLGNSRWHATTIPEHRWLNLPRITDPAPELPDSCPLCPWPDMPPLPPPPSSCPECGWMPRAPGGVPLHRRRAHGVIGANANGQRRYSFRRRGKTTEGGLRIHLARAHGIKGAGQSKSTYATEAEWIRTKNVASRDRLLLAAPADTGPGLLVTAQEAALLGWIAGDGCVSHSTKARGLQVSIGQTKREHFPAIEAALDCIPHARYEYPKRNRHVVWMLKPDYARDLMARAGHPKHEAFRQVLAMSAEQRDAWLQAMTAAEGHIDECGRAILHQALGPVHDAIVLAFYLSGKRPRILPHTRNHERWSDVDAISGNIPVVTGEYLRKEDAGYGSVWRVTTELGTCTVEEDGHVFLTGDSDC